MSQESPGLGQRAKSLVDQAKRRTGVGDPPLATEAGSRAAGMSEAFRAFGDGDLDRFLDAFAEDVEWSGPKGENFPGAGNHQGRPAVREEFLSDVERSYVSFGFRPEHYLESEAENVVVALGSFIGEGVKGSGELDAPAVQVWEFDGDKVVAVNIYTDSDAFPGVVTQQEAKQEKEDDEEKSDAAEAKGEAEKDDKDNEKDDDDEDDEDDEDERA